MGLFRDRLAGRVLALALLVSLMASTGCRTATPSSLFTASGPEWQVQEGQALWRPRAGMPELGGDLVMASQTDGRCMIQFTKTPLPLVQAETAGTHWLIYFPPRKLSFAGRGSPPSRFAWLYLHAALAGEPLPADLRFQRKPEGGWRLENTRSGETVDGFFAP